MSDYKPAAVIAAEWAPPQLTDTTSLPLKASMTRGRSHEVLLPCPSLPSSPSPANQQTNQVPSRVTRICEILTLPVQYFLDGHEPLLFFWP